MHRAEKITVNCRVNGAPASLEVYPMERLLDVLRETVDLTGTKEGCGEGECGACSIWVDGQLVNSCLVPAVQAEGSDITTIEGIAKRGGALLQKCFVREGGAQCGICTPGMIMASAALLGAEPRPSDERIRERLAGNLCRCTGYMRIVDSVRAACAGDGAP